MDVVGTNTRYTRNELNVVRNIVSAILCLKLHIPEGKEVIDILVKFLNLIKSHNISNMAKLYNNVFEMAELLTLLIDNARPVKEQLGKPMESAKSMESEKIHEGSILAFIDNSNKFLFGTIAQVAFKHESALYINPSCSSMFESTLEYSIESIPSTSWKWIINKPSGKHYLQSNSICGGMAEVDFEKSLLPMLQNCCKNYDIELHYNKTDNELCLQRLL